jgi:hypothetical protein
LLGLWWENVKVSDLDAATIRFTHQVDRKGRRVPLKTDESKATLPLPRSAALMLLEHKARSAHVGPQAFVFATRSGRPLGQRNVLRALYLAQERARDTDGRPTFPELFEHDQHGHLVVDERGRYCRGGSRGRNCHRCRTSTPCGTRPRWTARTRKRRATCCATRTRT